MNNKTDNGFTLVELMVVVAIISLLAAIALPQYLKFTLKSKRAEAFLVANAIYKSQFSFFAQNDYYYGICVPTVQVCQYNSGNDPNLIKEINKNFGLGEITQTKMGYRFYWSILQSPFADGNHYPTKYGLALENNLDADPFEDLVLIQSDDLYSGASGIPYIRRDDITNTTH